MLQGNQNRRWQIALVLFLTGLLVAVRAFESQLFYDPFIQYFKSEYADRSYPVYNEMSLFLHWIFRYALNSMVTLAILYVVFKEVPMVQFSALLLSVFLIVLLIAMFVLLHFATEDQKMTLFYVRRFIIQPIFLLLFIPGFYFQKQLEKK